MRTIGLVLAGGRATRMGGVDKGLQLFRGEPLALRALRRMRPQTGGLALSAKRSLSAYRRLLPPDIPILPDLRSGYPGPLAGLEAVIARLPEPERQEIWIAAAPCDCPFFPEDLVRRLALAAGRESPAAVVRTGGRLQPAFFLVRADQGASLKAYLDEGGRRMRAWLQEIGAAPADFEEEGVFLNCNTLEELALAQRQATSLGLDSSWQRRL